MTQLLRILVPLEQLLFSFYVLAATLVSGERKLAVVLLSDQQPPRIIVFAPRLLGMACGVAVSLA